jgi:hypothetical protein
LDWDLTIDIFMYQVAAKIWNFYSILRLANPTYIYEFKAFK